MNNIDTLKLWMNEMKINNWIHLQTMNYYKYLNKWLSIPPILISAVSGTVLLTNTENIIPADKLNLGTGIILTLSAFLQGMKSFFQLDEKIAQHEKYAKLYKEIAYEIEEFLIVPEKYRYLLLQQTVLNLDNQDNIEDIVVGGAANHINKNSSDDGEIFYRFIDNIKKRRVYISSNEPIPPAKLWAKFKNMLKNSKLLRDILDDELYTYKASNIISNTTINIPNDTSNSAINNISTSNATAIAATATIATSNIAIDKVQDTVQDTLIDIYNANSSIHKKPPVSLATAKAKNKYINQIMFNLGQDFEL